MFITKNKIIKGYFMRNNFKDLFFITKYFRINYNKFKNIVKYFITSNENI